MAFFVINITIWVAEEPSQPGDLRYELQSYQNYNRFLRKIKNDKIFKFSFVYWPVFL